jgi:7-keto-8-aminopelargonate synthetase-like enzyme
MTNFNLDETINNILKDSEVQEYSELIAEFGLFEVVMGFINTRLAIADADGSVMGLEDLVEMFRNPGRFFCMGLQMAVRQPEWARAVVEDMKKEINNEEKWAEMNKSQDEIADLLRVG